MILLTCEKSGVDFDRHLMLLHMCASNQEPSREEQRERFSRPWKNDDEHAFLLCMRMHVCLHLWPHILYQDCIPVLGCTVENNGDSVQGEKLLDCAVYA